MRIFTNFRDAVGEVRRDLKEMGIRVHPETMQDKHVADDPQYETLELQFYSFSVTAPVPKDLSPTQPWADAEFAERISDRNLNPGDAWKLRRDVWAEFLEGRERNAGHFAYTYSERLSRRQAQWRLGRSGGADEFQGVSTQLEQLVANIRTYPHNRNHLLSIWDRTDLWRVGEHRVPCSIFYHFLLRDGELMMHYVSRSCDIMTHMENDLYLAARLQALVAEQTQNQVGRFVATFDSLHSYAKDLTGTF